jgi:hypothetical protein
MLAITTLVYTLTIAGAVRPRECASCGAYSGPNVARILDPYLRQADIWPEFTAATCRFEVARGAFVTLDRSACASEAAYRASRGVS